ncbi:unnamed protein product [Moneuplotes crassus]|uniref:Uncharacterized protein n=1 Tax=Euplotes crassus TaxID=5936 RepID=A0AAD2D9B1_EUPCR|nr:unnamed protein product [Moneuplotes crassus]
MKKCLRKRTTSNHSACEMFKNSKIFDPIKPKYTSNPHPPLTHSSSLSHPKSRSKALLPLKIHTLPHKNPKMPKPQHKNSQNLQSRLQSSLKHQIDVYIKNAKIKVTRGGDFDTEKEEEKALKQPIFEVATRAKIQKNKQESGWLKGVEKKGIKDWNEYTDRYKENPKYMKYTKLLQPSHNSKSPQKEPPSRQPGHFSVSITQKPTPKPHLTLLSQPYLKPPKI